MCGQIFCNACSSYWVDGTLLDMVPGPVRCCKICSEQLNERQAKEWTKMMWNRQIDSTVEVAKRPAAVGMSEADMSTLSMQVLSHAVIESKMADAALVAGHVHETPTAKKMHFSRLQKRFNIHMLVH